MKLQKYGVAHWPESEQLSFSVGSGLHVLVVPVELSQYKPVSQATLLQSSPFFARPMHTPADEVPVVRQVRCSFGSGSHDAVTPGGGGDRHGSPAAGSCLHVDDTGSQ